MDTSTPEQETTDFPGVLESVPKQAYQLQSDSGAAKIPTLLYPTFILYTPHQECDPIFLGVFWLKEPTTNSGLD